MQPATVSPRPDAVAPAPAIVKLVVWDLDDTLWEGILLEDPEPALRPGIADIMRMLDDRGVLQSVASRNDSATAMAHLSRLGIDQFLIFPQIGWGAKSLSVFGLSKQLSLSMDSILFVDDQDFELAEVSHACSGVRTLNARDIHMLESVARIEDVPTPDARRRRDLYQQEAKRTEAEEEFSGPPEEFMASLGLHLRVARADESDLARAEELTSRTNQLNTTGITFSRAQLASYAKQEDHILLVARLDDRFGDYGTIGLALIESTPEALVVKLLLVSCRVISRGVGAMLLSQIAGRASEGGQELRVEFRDTGRNRPMKVALMMGGFRLGAEGGGKAVFVKDKQIKSSIPPYVRVEAEW